MKPSRSSTTGRPTIPFDGDSARLVPWSTRRQVVDKRSSYRRYKLALEQGEQITLRSHALLIDAFSSPLCAAGAAKRQP
jgi:hypothetical protein